MKRQLAAGFIAFTLLCFQTSFSQVQQVKLTAATDMRGAYTMLKQAADTGTGPFVLNTQQMKIFSDKYVMYVHRHSDSDSSADFGVGTYSLENGKIIEHMFYGTAGPQNNTFQLAVNKRKDGYSQVINFPGDAQNSGWMLTEDYTTSGKGIASPLDGAWSMRKVIFTDKNGKTETYESNDSARQFKFFEGGNFMWANYIKSKETGAAQTAYGYGSFKVNSPNQITETNTSSTYSTLLVGKPVVLKIKLTGKDGYEQTIEEPDGSTRREVYERLK